MDAAERHALTCLCDELAELRRECARQSGERQRMLRRIEDEARARRPVLALLAELLRTDRGGALRALGSGLPGAGPGQADEERFGCPDKACDREVIPPPAGPVPHCQLTGDPMTRY